MDFRDEWRDGQERDAQVDAGEPQQRQSRPRDSIHDHASEATVLETGATSKAAICERRGFRRLERYPTGEDAGSGKATENCSHFSEKFGRRCWNGKGDLPRILKDDRANHRTPYDLLPQESRGG